MYRRRKNAGRFVIPDLSNLDANEVQQKKESQGKNEFIHAVFGGDDSSSNANNATSQDLSHIRMLERERKEPLPSFVGMYPFTSISNDVVSACKDMFIIVHDLYGQLPEVDAIPNQTVVMTRQRTDSSKRIDSKTNAPSKEENYEHASSSSSSSEEDESDEETSQKYALSFTFTVSKAIRRVTAESSDEWLVRSEDVLVTLEGSSRCRVSLTPRPGEVGITGITITAYDLVGHTTRTFMLHVKKPDHTSLLIDKEAEQRKKDEGTNARLWSMRRVCKFIRDNGYTNKHALFEKRNVNGVALLKLTVDDLKTQFYFASDSAAQDLYETIATLRERAIKIETKEREERLKHEHSQEQRARIIEVTKAMEEEREEKSLHALRSNVYLSGSRPSIQSTANDIDVDLYLYAFLLGRVSSEISDRSAKMMKGGRFYCLGSTDGMICFAAALLRDFQVIIGIEQDERLSFKSELFLDRYHVRCRSRLSYAKRKQEIKFFQGNPLQCSTLDQAHVIIMMWSRIKIQNFFAFKNKNNKATTQEEEEEDLEWTACWEQLSVCTTGTFLLVVVEDEKNVKKFLENQREKHRLLHGEEEEEEEEEESDSEEEEEEDDTQELIFSDSEQEEEEEEEEEKKESKTRNEEEAYEPESPLKQLPGWRKVEILHKLRMATGDDTTVVMYIKESMNAEGTTLAPSPTQLDKKHKTLGKLVSM